MDHSEVKHLPKVDHTPAELDEASKLLLKAADLIEERGWCQGEHEVGRRLCVLGALHRAEGGDPYDMTMSAAALTARSRFALAVGTEMIGSKWNDSEWRTKDEVVSKLRAVALGL